MACGKGQEISEQKYEVVALTKIWTKKFEKFCPEHLGQNFSIFLVHILGNATSYFHSEISWPLEAKLYDACWAFYTLQQLESNRLFIEFPRCGWMIPMEYYWIGFANFRTLWLAHEIVSRNFCNYEFFKGLSLFIYSYVLLM